MAHSAPRNKSLRALVALLFLTATLTGCDKYKEERASLSTKIKGIEAQLARLKDERAGVSKELETLTSEIKQHSRN